VVYSGRASRAAHLLAWRYFLRANQTSAQTVKRNRKDRRRHFEACSGITGCHAKTDKAINLQFQNKEE